MTSAMCNIPTVPLVDALYVVVINDTTTEGFDSFEEAAYAYGRWLEALHPHASHRVALLKVQKMLAPGEEIGFY